MQYQAETAPARIRGTLTATYQLFITFGILVACKFNLNPFTFYSSLPYTLDCISIATRNLPGAGSWRTVVGIGMIWPVILGVGILFMPESPRLVFARVQDIE